MEMKQHISKHVIPFTFLIDNEGSFNRIIKTTLERQTQNNEPVWNLRQFRLQYSRFNHHIFNLIYADIDNGNDKPAAVPDSAVGIALSLNENAKIESIPSKKWKNHYTFNFAERDSGNCETAEVHPGSIDLALEQIELYLFRTGVGFFVFSTQLDTDDLDEYIAFYKRFRAVVSNGGPNMCLKGAAYQMSDLIKDIFSFGTAGLRTTGFFENNKDEFDRAALQYSGVLIDAAEEAIDRNELDKKIPGAQPGI
jgi:hypothetical protein